MTTSTWEEDAARKAAADKARNDSLIADRKANLIGPHDPYQIDQ